MWPRERAIGKRITTAYTGTRISRVVVGVLRERSLHWHDGRAPHLRCSFRSRSTRLHVDGTSSSSAAAATSRRFSRSVRRLVGELDPQVAVTRVETLQTGR